MANMYPSLTSTNFQALACDPAWAGGRIAQSSRDIFPFDWRNEKIESSVDHDMEPGDKFL
jgi:hypothetical protein